MKSIITNNKHYRKGSKSKNHKELAFQVPCYSEGLIIYFYDNY